MPSPERLASMEYAPHELVSQEVRRLGSLAFRRSYGLWPEEPFALTPLLVLQAATQDLVLSNFLMVKMGMYFK